MRAAWHGALAAAVAWGIAELLNEILGTHEIKGLGVNVRIGDGPVYPVVNVAIIAALAFGLVALSRAPAPSHLRPRHPPRVLAAMYLGAGFPADVLGGNLVGFAVAALVRVAFGAPGGGPRWPR